MIALYAVNISAVPSYAAVAAMRTAVSEARQARIERYRFDADKIRCLSAELLLRSALAAEYGLSSSQIHIAAGENGKPQLADSKIRFNLSHSGEWVICAVGQTEIGADVEEIRETNFRTVAESFSAAEQALLEHTAADAQTDLFYRIWTLKESYVKYRGTGLLESFSDFTVLPCSAHTAKCTQPADSTAVSFYSLKPDARHWISLCSSEPLPAENCTPHIVSASALFSAASYKK